MNRLLSPSPIFLNEAIGILRIIVGLLMIYHGQEVFNSEIMDSYTEYDALKGPSAKFMSYLGKSSELLSGLLLFLGLFTRLGAVLLIGTLSYVTFVIGHGIFWYQDQHPFMFVLFGILFFFTGPGKWSLDALLTKRETAE